MTRVEDLDVAIVDYGLGNLFSLEQAWLHLGLNAKITSRVEDLGSATVVVLPGVGAFGEAMKALHGLDLVKPLRERAAQGKPLVGICLGMQLMFSSGTEFGRHEGLGLISGEVVRFAFSDTKVKIPHIGWNKIISYPLEGEGSELREESTVGSKVSPHAGIKEGEYMYFVHSYYPLPEDPTVGKTWTDYSGVKFCSSIQHGGIYACQFHPERSGQAGLRLLRNIWEWAKEEFVAHNEETAGVVLQLPREISAE